MLLIFYLLRTPSRYNSWVITYLICTYLDMSSGWAFVFCCQFSLCQALLLSGPLPRDWALPASALLVLDGLLFNIINYAMHYVHMVLLRQNSAYLSTLECKNFTGMVALLTVWTCQSDFHYFWIESSEIPKSVEVGPLHITQVVPGWLLPPWWCLYRHLWQHGICLCLCLQKTFSLHW